MVGAIVGPEAQCRLAKLRIQQMGNAITVHVIVPATLMQSVVGLRKNIIADEIRGYADVLSVRVRPQCDGFVVIGSRGACARAQHRIKRAAAGLGPR